MITGAVEHRVALIRQCNSSKIYFLQIIASTSRTPIHQAGRHQLHLPFPATVRHKHDSRISGKGRLEGFHEKSKSAPAQREDGLRSISYVEHPQYPDISLRSLRSNPRAGQAESLTSTRPAKLEDVEPAGPNEDGSIPLQERAKYAFRVGKAAVKFYKTGLKNIWGNYKELRKIKQKIGSYTVDQAAKYGSKSITDNPEDKIPAISRAEYQLCIRTQGDLLKLIPFALVFVVFGEFTPLVITFVPPSMVPTTCLLPKQQAQLRDRRIVSTRSLLEAGNKPTGASTEADSSESKQLIPETNNELDTELMTSRLVGLTSFSKPIPILTPLLDSFYIKPRLQRRFDQILSDTILIRREGGFKNLSAQDVYEYGFKYGLLTLYHYMIEAHDNDRPLDVEGWKDKLVPILEAEADQMLTCDWKRLKPESHWLQAYRHDIFESPDYKNFQRLRQLS